MELVVEMDQVQVVEGLVVLELLIQVQQLVDSQFLFNHIQLR